MTTQKQTDANRRNAASSTGPKTQAGKDASRLNALKHGLGAESPILPTESEEAFAAFRDGLLKNLAPQGALENQLAEEIVDLTWRLRRASTLEHGVLARGVSAVDQAFFSEKKRRFEITEQDIRDEQFKMTFGLTGHSPKHSSTNSTEKTPMPEQIIVPDIAGALVGWRCWGLAKTSSGAQLVSHGDTIWPTDW